MLNLMIIRTENRKKDRKTLSDLNLADLNKILVQCWYLVVSL